MSTESKRQQRFAGVIQQDLADIFLREASAWLPGSMITVTKVRITSDLAIARIYLSFLGVKDAEEAISSLRSRTNEIRYKLGSKIKNQVKNVPHLEFFIDDSNAYAEHMNKLFAEINKQSGGNERE